MPVVMVSAAPCGTANASGVFDGRVADERADVICSIDCRTIVNTLAYGLCADWRSVPMDWHSVVVHIAGHLDGSRWPLSTKIINTHIFNLVSS